MMTYKIILIMLMGFIRSQEYDMTLTIADADINKKDLYVWCHDSHDQLLYTYDPSATSNNPSNSPFVQFDADTKTLTVSLDFAEAMNVQQIKIPVRVTVFLLMNIRDIVYDVQKDICTYVVETVDKFGILEAVTCDSSTQHDLVKLNIQRSKEKETDVGKGLTVTSKTGVDDYTCNNATTDNFTFENIEFDIIDYRYAGLVCLGVPFLILLGSECYKLCGQYCS